MCCVRAGHVAAGVAARRHMIRAEERVLYPSKAFRVLKDHFLPSSQSQIRAQEEKLKSLRMRSNENPTTFLHP